MSDERALLAAIWEHPNDDAPRLVYADWLDEAGDPARAARAEFIRLQCELFRLDESDPRRPGLEKRQAALFRRYRRRWGLPGEPVVWYVRGFPGMKPLTDDFWRAGRQKPLPQEPGGWYRERPAWELGGPVTASNWGEVFGWRHLDRLGKLHLGTRLPAGWVGAVAGEPRLRNVVSLRLDDRALRPADFRRLLDAWAGRSLYALALNAVGLTRTAVRLLAEHPALARLRVLRLGLNNLTADGLAALAAAPWFANLRELTLGENHVGFGPLAEFLRTAPLRNLTSLDLWQMPVGDDGARAIAEAPALARLRELRLVHAHVGDGGARALAGSPHLNRLEGLEVYQNPCDSPAVLRRLKERFGPGVKA